MLLASGERQNESAAAFGIGGLTCKTARHLPDELISRRNNAGEGPAVARCKAEALGFHGNDVGFGRRAHQAERNTFGDGGDK